MNRNLVSALEDNARMLQKAQNEQYADMTRKGKAMVHLPDSNIKLIVPNELVHHIVTNCQFVMSEDSTEHNATGVLMPFDGQLNVTYFTGD